MSGSKLPFIASLGLLLTTGCASYSVRRVQPDSRLDHPAVFYTLPRAVIMVEVPVKQTMVTPGLCAKYGTIAEQILGLKKEDLPTALKTSYKLGDFQISTRSQPDPEQVFAVRVDDDFLVNRVHTLELSETGFLSGATMDSKSTIEDFTVKTITLAANLAGKAIGGYGAALPGGSPPKKFDEAALCDKLAKDIHAIRKSRQDLLAGRGQMVSPSKDALEFMDKGLREMEQELLAGFTGAKELKEVPVRCEFIPSVEQRSKTLFELTEEGRIKAVDSSCAIPSLVAAADSDKVKSQVTIGVQEDSAQFSDVVTKGQRTPTSEEGFFYRIPATAWVSVAIASEPRSRTLKLIPQLGTVTFLPGDVDISSLATKYELTLHANSGALQKFTGTTTPLPTSPIDSLGGATNTIFDALKQKQSSDAGRQLSDLELQRKLLEEQVKIKELQTQVAD